MDSIHNKVSNSLCFKWILKTFLYTYICVTTIHNTCKIIVKINISSYPYTLWPRPADLEITADWSRQAFLLGADWSSLESLRDGEGVLSILFVHQSGFPWPHKGLPLHIIINDQVLGAIPHSCKQRCLNSLSAKVDLSWRPRKAPK